MRHALLAALLPLAAGCGGPLLHADLEVPEARLTLAAQRFPASVAPPASWCGPSTSSCVATDLSYDLGQQLDLLSRPATAYDVRLTSLDIALAATEGGDLGGVAAATVLAYPPGGGTPVELARYRRSTADPAPTSITLSGGSGVDLTPYLEAGSIRLRAELSYDRATPAFQADVTAAFFLKVRLDYGALL
jgi:hypothetical protein